MDDPRPPADALALTALRFAAGDLPPPAAEAFAARVADDPAAQDALERAFRLSAAAMGQGPPTADPLTREAVRDRLRPGLLGWLFPRRPYRGHPAVWAALGGTAAAALTAFGVWLGDRPTEIAAPSQIAVVPPVTPPVVPVAVPPPAVFAVAPPPRKVTPAEPTDVAAADGRELRTPDPEAKPGRGGEPKAAIDASIPSQ